jgi:hypothetical protein
VPRVQREVAEDLAVDDLAVTGRGGRVRLPKQQHLDRELAGPHRGAEHLLRRGQAGAGQQDVAGHPVHRAHLDRVAEGGARRAQLQDGARLDAGA